MKNAPSVVPFTRDTENRPLPQNLEAERSILGAVLLDNHAFNAAVQILRSEDFFLPQHRHIFVSMVQLSEKQQAIDTITLVEESRPRKRPPRSGWRHRIPLATADGLPRVANVAHYARIVKQRSMLRQLAHTAEAIRDEALLYRGDYAGVVDPHGRADRGALRESGTHVRTGCLA